MPNRITIIKPDNMVYVNGLALPVDCSGLPDNFHALQWYDPDPLGGARWGEIEWVDAIGRHVSNERITSLGPYQSYVDKWREAKVKYDEEVAKRERPQPAPPRGRVDVVE